MSDSDGFPHLDNGPHHESRSRSPVSPQCAGQTPVEREERWLAEDAVPVGPPAGEPQAAPSSPEVPAPEPVPAGLAAPAAQAAAPATLSASGTPDALPNQTHRAATAAHDDHTAAPATPPARGTGPTRAKSASPGGPQGAALAATESWEAARYRAYPQRSHTHTSPHKPYPPEASFPEGRPRLVRAPVPKYTPMDITLLQLQRPVVEAGHEGTGGDGDQRRGRGGDNDCAGRGAKRRGTRPGTEGKRGKVAGGGGGGGQVSGTGKGRGSGRGGRRQGSARAHAAAARGRRTRKAKSQAAAEEGRRMGKAKARPAAGGLQGTIREAD